MVQNNLILRLIEIQDKYSFNDRQMSELLGCSRQLYQRTRSGESLPRHKILKGIISAFPELKDEVLVFLTDYAIGVAPFDTKVSDTNKKPQNGNLGKFFKRLKEFILRK